VLAKRQGRSRETESEGSTKHMSGQILVKVIGE